VLFKASGNAHRWDAPNVTFYNDFRDQLVEDAAYQKETTVDRFVYLFEKTATQWERDEFKMAERCKKRPHASSSNSGLDRSSNTENITHDRSTGGDTTKTTKRLWTFRSVNSSGNHGHCPLRWMWQAKPQAERLQVQRDSPRLQQNRTVDWSPSS